MFQRKPVSSEYVREIIECGQRAPSTSNAQTYSIIWVKNEERTRKLWEACGRRTSILEAPVTLAVCADVRKLTRIVDQRGRKKPLERLRYERKIFAIIDASLVAENIVIAAEAVGLTSLFVGSALANRKVIEALEIPKGVLPVSLLCIGYANEDPPLRPRFPIETVLFTNTYRDLDEQEIDTVVDHMNQTLNAEGYYSKYDARRPSDYEWIDHMITEAFTDRNGDERFKRRMRKTEFYPTQPLPAFSEGLLGDEAP